jgi:hypothetical protein
MAYLKTVNFNGIKAKVEFDKANFQVLKEDQSKRMTTGEFYKSSKEDFYVGGKWFTVYNEASQTKRNRKPTKALYYQGAKFPDNEKKVVEHILATTNAGINANGVIVVE